MIHTFVAMYGCCEGDSEEPFYIQLSSPGLMVCQYVVSGLHLHSQSSKLPGCRLRGVCVNRRNVSDCSQAASMQ